MNIISKTIYMAFGALTASLVAYGMAATSDGPVGPQELYKTKSQTISVLGHRGRMVFILEEKGQIKSIDVR